MRQRVVHRDASEPVAFETLVWLAERPRNISRGHRDPQHLFLGQHCAAARKHHQSDQELMPKRPSDGLILGFKLVCKKSHKVSKLADLSIRATLCKAHAMLANPQTFWIAHRIGAEF